MAETINEKPVKVRDFGADNPSDSDLEDNSVNESSLLRKLDARLLPAVGILYLMSFLDRSNGTKTPRPHSSPALNSETSWQCKDRRTRYRLAHEYVLSSCVVAVRLIRLQLGTST